MSFRDLTIRNKLFLLMSSLILIVIVFMSQIYISQKNQIMFQKETKLKATTEIALKILERYYNFYRNGILSEKDAQEKAKNIIADLRFEGTKYFFIIDTTHPYPKMIMHPIKPALNGKIMDNSKFNCATKMKEGGKHGWIKLNKKSFFTAMVNMCEKSGEGYIVYLWPKPLKGGGVTKQAYPKLSYVTLFEPWNWIIGTGMYIDDVHAEIWSFLAKTIKQGLLILILLSILPITIVILVSKDITDSVAKLKWGIEKIAQGDFSIKLDLNKKDEIGEIAEQIKKLQSVLQNDFGKILTYSDRLTSNGENMVKLSNSLMNLAQQNVETSTTVSSATTELSYSITEVKGHVDNIYEEAKDASKNVKEGEEVIETVFKYIGETNVTIEETSHKIKELYEFSNEIGNIATIIREIAKQTNLLALNASIEAARAGEAGKGFTVVAKEIEDLARRTAEFTSKIEGTIQNTLKGIEEIVQIIQEINEKGEKNIKETEKAEKSLTSIVNGMERLHTMIESISIAISQMVEAVDTINRDMEKMSSNTKELETNSQNVECVAEDLQGIAQEMRNMLNKFRL